MYPIKSQHTYSFNVRMSGLLMLTAPSATWKRAGNLNWLTLYAKSCDASLLPPRGQDNLLSHEGVAGRAHLINARTGRGGAVREARLR